MCYSKEVSLAVSLALFLASALFWYYFISKGKRNEKYLHPFYKNVLFAFLCIGGHQFSEFLSILTGNELIYKIGLIMSISSMYFLMRSLQYLTHYSFNGYLFVPIIFGLSLNILTTPMTFENFNFWVRGHSHLIWVTFWILLFIYWNICILYMIIKSKKLNAKKSLKLFALESIDISFLLTVIFAYFLIYMDTNSFNSFKDIPSIWCTFFVVQILFIPHLFNNVKTYLRTTKTQSLHQISLKTQLLLIVFTAVVFIFFSYFAPFFSDIILKFTFR